MCKFALKLCASALCRMAMFTNMGRMGSKAGGKSLEQLSNYQLLIEDSVP